LNRPHHTALLCHLATPCAAIESIEVQAQSTAGGALELSYRIRGAPGAILLPSPLPPGPADNLWQHTCCEAFIATTIETRAGPRGNPKKYLEFNFSPSGQWAAYRFSDYRERDTDFSPAAAPQMTLQVLPDGFQLNALIAPELLPADQTLMLGLTTVIEAADGSKSYWALRHCASQPDFHLRPSFTLPLNRNTP
jgi:hypothetical protein